ncbi:hypothetical protein [Streptomyces triticagri]|uniref:hypothetical protein n=1 Tax=Streptomyces triticagri TaxID=2293568 RepID=UPI001314A2B0|nr:hypothetical protein [Streptomyces triticagri]
MSMVIDCVAADGVVIDRTVFDSTVIVSRPRVRDAGSGRGFGGKHRWTRQYA